MNKPTRSVARYLLVHFQRAEQTNCATLRRHFKAKRKCSVPFFSTGFLQATLCTTSSVFNTACRSQHVIGPVPNDPSDHEARQLLKRFAPHLTRRAAFLGRHVNIQRLCCNHHSKARHLPACATES